MTEKPGIKKKIITKETGLTSWLMEFYINEGVVVPEIHKGEGQGDHHGWSRKNLVEFFVIKRLSDHKVKLPKIRKVIEFLNHDLMKKGVKIFDNLPPPGDTEYLIIYETKDKNDLKVEFVKDGPSLRQRHTLQDLLKDHHSAIIVNFTELVRKSHEVKV